MNLDQILEELREELRVIDERIALLSALALDRSQNGSVPELEVVDLRLQRPVRQRRYARAQNGTPAAKPV